MLSKKTTSSSPTPTPARRWASCSAASGCRSRSPRSCPARTACPCASRSWTRTSSPSATPTAASAWSTPTARTAARRCSSAATRRTACAASTTAGSSTSTASASTCRTRPKARPSGTRSTSSRYPCVEAGDLIWAYMGPKDKQPPFPEFEWTQAAARAPLRHQVPPRVQLPAGHGGRLRPGHGRFLHSTLRQQIRNPLNPAPAAATQRHALGSRRRRRRRALPVRRRQPPRHRQAGLGRARGHRRPASSASTPRRAPATAWPTLAGRAWMMPIFCTAGIARPNTSPATCACRSTTRASDVLPPALELRRPSPQDDLVDYKHGGYAYPEMIPGTWQTKANVHNDYDVDRVAQKNFTLHRHQDLPAAGHRDDGEPVGPDRRPHAGAPGQLRLPDHPPPPPPAEGREGPGGRASSRRSRGTRRPTATTASPPRAPRSKEAIANVRAKSFASRIKEPQIPAG